MRVNKLAKEIAKAVQEKIYTALIKVWKCGKSSKACNSLDEYTDEEIIIVDLILELIP